MYAYAPLGVTKLPSTSAPVLTSDSGAPQVTKSYFYDLSNAQTTYMKALQRFLNVPVTGMWNQASHDALRAFMKYWAVDIGYWGGDPGKVARNAVVLLSPTEGQFQRVIPLLKVLGLPTASYQTYRNSIDSAALYEATAGVEDHIRSVESRVAPQPDQDIRNDIYTTKKAGLGLILVGILAIGVVAWAVRRYRS